MNHTSDSNRLLATASQLIEAGQFEEARRAFLELAEMAPDEPLFEGMLAHCCDKVGDVAGAIRHREREVLLAPREAAGWLQLGLALAKGGKTREPLEMMAVARHLAAARKNPNDERLYAMLDAPAPPGKGIEKLEQPLVYALALRGFDAALALWLRAGEAAEVEEGSETGFSALAAAAGANRSGAVRLLLAHGADPRRSEAHGLTPLHIAAMQAHTETIALLLEAGADPNTRDDKGVTPLVLAAARRHPVAVERLLAAGADPSAADQNGLTALHAAILENKGAERVPTVQTVMALIAAGADTGAMSLLYGTPLETAARADCGECARLLIEAMTAAGGNPDLDSAVQEGESAGNSDLAELIRAHGTGER